MDDEFDLVTESKLNTPEESNEPSYVEQVKSVVTDDKFVKMMMYFYMKNTSTTIFRLGVKALLLRNLLNS